MNRLTIAALSAVMAVMAPTIAIAQTSPVELKGDVKVATFVIENGEKKQVFVDPRVVVPGDALLFSTAYHNTGATTVKDFVVTNPLPEGVMMAPQGNEKLIVSVDGGKTFGGLATLSVTGADGASRPAQASDVTHIRWVLPVLDPGSSGSLYYHAIVR